MQRGQRATQLATDTAKDSRASGVRLGQKGHKVDGVDGR